MTKMMTKIPKNDFKIESTSSRSSLISSFMKRNQVSRIKKNQDQDSRLKIQESREDSIKISIKFFFQNIE